MKDSIFARSQRNEVGDTLLLRDVARLSRCSLDDCHGQIGNDDPLLQRLHTLISLGQLAPVRTEEVEVEVPPLLYVIGRSRQQEPHRTRKEQRHYIHRADLLAHREALGNIGAELVKWIGVKVGTETMGTATKALTAGRQNGDRSEPQQWAQLWHAEFDPLFRTIGGSAKLGTMNDLLDGHQLKFATTDLCCALEKFDNRTVPDKSPETLAKQLRLLYPDFSWATGNGGADRAALIEKIKDAYAEGKVLDDDQELNDHLPQGVLKFRRG
jgi:hypothetical protein